MDHRNRCTIQQVMQTLLRDGALYQGSGRWLSGRPDPADPIIGAAGAVNLYRRSGGRLQPMASDHDAVQPAEPDAEPILSLDPARMLSQPILATLLTGRLIINVSAQ